MFFSRDMIFDELSHGIDTAKDEKERKSCGY